MHRDDEEVEPDGGLSFSRSEATREYRRKPKPEKETYSAKKVQERKETSGNASRKTVFNRSKHRGQQQAPRYEDDSPEEHSNNEEEEVRGRRSKQSQNGYSNPHDDPDYRRDAVEFEQRRDSNGHRNRHDISDQSPDRVGKRRTKSTSSAFVPKHERQNGPHTPNKVDEEMPTEYKSPLVLMSRSSPSSFTPSKQLDERTEKAAKLYDLWKNDNQQKVLKQEKVAADEGISGIPSRSPSVPDVESVIFSPSNAFKVGEIVLVPRTRGGFNYGRVIKETSKKHCFFAPNVEHKNQAWRVVYPSNGKSLFKELPAPYIGKLPDGPSLSSADLALTIAAETSEFDLRREVGAPAHYKDIQTAIMSPQVSLSVDEIVLVPRSGGGFSYGKISRETNISCCIASFSETHPLHAWRVIIDEENGNVIRKDLISACIGKLTLTKNEPMHINPKRAQAILNAQAFTTIDAHLAAKKESELIEEEERATLNKSFEQDEGNNEEIQLWGTPIDPKKFGVNLDEQAPKTPVSAPATPSKAAPLQQVGGLLQVDKIDKKKLLQQLLKPKTDQSKHLIVIDGPNVAKKHGKDSEFSAKGIKIALDYWNNLGHDAIAFVPEHYIRRKPGQSITLKEFLPRADNVPLLNQLIEEGRVVLTPPQDYDDSYCIEYAMRHNGCIVTNDRYNDHIEKQKQERGNKARREKLQWIRDHSISFTFVRDDFLPNPDFKFPAMSQST